MPPLVLAQEVVRDIQPFGGQPTRDLREAQPVRRGDGKLGQTLGFLEDRAMRDLQGAQHVRGRELGRALSRYSRPLDHYARTEFVVRGGRRTAERPEAKVDQSTPSGR